MRRAPRTVAFAVLAGLALVAAGCSSNNKGKIEGKWKLVTFPGMDDFEQVSKQFNLVMYFEFEPNGTFALGFDSPNKFILEMMKQKIGSTRFTAKYKLLSGDGVEIYDFSPGPLADAFQKDGAKKARTSIKINGDEMTLTDPDGKVGKFTRMKEGEIAPEKPNGPPPAAKDDDTDG